MKNLVIAALMASAVAIATLGRGEELCADGGVGESSFPLAAGPALTVTNCQWDAETTYEVNSTATSLSISGGSTSGPIALVLNPSNAFALTIKNAFSVNGGVTLQGALPPNSTVTITGSIFKLADSGSIPLRRGLMPAGGGSGPLLHLRYLRISGSTMLISNNVFEADTTGYNDAEALMTPYSAGLATLTISDNLFNASGTNGWFTGIRDRYTRFANSVFAARSNTFVSSGASCSGLYMGLYSSFASSKSFKKQSGRDAKRGGKGEGRRRARRSAAPAEPNARPFAANAGMDWSQVSDEEARTVYGKSTFEITDNVFADVEYPWDLYDYDGADWKIEGNTAASTHVSIVGYYEYSGVYFPISITMNKNTIAVTEGQTASITADFYELPAKSSLYIAQNTIVTGAQSEVYAVRLTSDSDFPNSTVVSISQNELVSYNGTTGLAAGRWMVYYNGGSRRGSRGFLMSSSEQSQIALCDNTLFGTKLDTDELVNSTLGYTDVPLSLLPVSECSAYTLAPTTVNAAPQHRWSMACAVTSLVALATAALV